MNKIEKDRQDRMYIAADKALLLYVADNSDIVAANQIIKFANQGCYTYTDAKAVADMFIDWGTRNPSYIWLRLAKDGQLAMKVRNKKVDYEL